MTVRIGVIGASFAKAAYLPALRHVPGAEVVSLASARLESARATADAFGVPYAYDDWQAMLREHELDLVCIATPTDTHAPIALAALDAGAHVLCEKPTAMDADEARAMRDRAAELGRISMMGHELRFNPNRRKLAELVSSGAIGEVRHAHIANVTPGWADPAGRPKGDWWSLAERGGGRLGANGSHQVDLLRWWFGEVRSVVGVVETMIVDRIDKSSGEPWQATADDFVQMTLRQERSRHSDVLMSGVARHNMDNVTQIFGSEGTILLTNQDERMLVGAPGAEFEDVSVADPNATLSGVGAGIWNVSFVALMQELCGAIRDGRPVRDGATFEDGLRNQLVLDAVKRSHAERRWIDLDG
ncbi:MAG: gfo/Idh/MocA family oxidoreductase [Trueperaceae bacterium]|nr:MAG: gfo/Idh/MocA family oxidoreductase [Trueperaceae bacterium]